VSGLIHNPTTTPASAVRLALVLVDADGAITGLRQVDLAGGAPAGGSAPFTLSATALGETAVDFTVLAEGRP
jgi:hypothetical protein